MRRVNAVISAEEEEQFIDDGAGRFVFDQGPDGFPAVVRMVSPIAGQLLVVGNPECDVLELLHALVDDGFGLGQLIDVGLLDLGTERIHGIVVNDDG